MYEGANIPNDPMPKESGCRPSSCNLPPMLEFGLVSLIAGCFLLYDRRMCCADILLAVERQLFLPVISPVKIGRLEERDDDRVKSW